MTLRTLVNGEPTEQLSVLDRAVCYGDGLFETVRLVGGVAPLWPRHMQRLRDSCARLQMPAPDETRLWREARLVTADLPQSVLRVSWTRGAGERGYAPPRQPQPTRVVAAFDPPPYVPGVYTTGVRLRVCDLRLASQPRLAGMKHLNRLEQVLARAEWDDPGIADGVLCDSRGRVVSTTMANLFARVEGELITPALTECGVAGVARAEILAHGAHIKVRDLTVDALFAATEVFLSSSVRGIVPVRRIGQQRYAPAAATRRWQQHWHNLGFAMEQSG